MFRAAQVTDQRYLPFRDYPAVDYMRLVFVVARIALRASWLARALRGVDGALRRVRS